MDGYVRRVSHRYASRPTPNFAANTIGSLASVRNNRRRLLKPSDGFSIQRQDTAAKVITQTDAKTNVQALL
jgi:hypothetical protein